MGGDKVFFKISNIQIRYVLTSGEACLFCLTVQDVLYHGYVEFVFIVHYVSEPGKNRVYKCKSIKNPVKLDVMCWTWTVVLCRTS